MTTEYSFIWRNFRSEATTSLDNIKELIKDVSFRKEGTLGVIEERIQDGTIGVAWQPSTLVFRLPVAIRHVSGYADSVYCIDGTVIVGFKHAVNYAVELLAMSKTDAESLLCSI